MERVERERDGKKGRGKPLPNSQTRPSRSVPNSLPISPPIQSPIIAPTPTQSDSSWISLRLLRRRRPAPLLLREPSACRRRSVALRRPPHRESLRWLWTKVYFSPKNWWIIAFDGKNSCSVDIFFFLNLFWKFWCVIQIRCRFFFFFFNERTHNLKNWGKERTQMNFQRSV